MLWHIYRYCCCGSLRYLDGDFRLIRIADLVSAVEKWVEVLDWEGIQHEYPELLRILPLLNALTPWSEKVLSRVPMDASPVPRNGGQIYQSYPSVYLAQHRQRGLINSLLDTFFPPEWWFRLHYGLPGGGCRNWVGGLLHELRVLGDLLVYLARLGLGHERPDPV